MSARRARRPGVLAVVLACVASGCTIQHTTVGRPLPAIDGLRVGVSTKADVLAALGPPTTLRRQHDGDLFVYRRSDSDSRMLRLVPYLVVYERTRATLRYDQIAVLFDEGGLLAGLGVEHEIPAGRADAP